MQSRPSTLFDASYPCRPDTVPAARHDVAAVAQAQGLTEPRVEDVRTVVSEAVTNAIVHTDGERGRIEVRVERHDAELCVIVRDDGPGMLPHRASGGLGL